MQRRSRLFIITDRVTRKSYLIDAGADVSVVPASFADIKRGPSTYKLYAANDTEIHLLGKLHLLPDLKNRRLLDGVTLLSAKGRLTNQTANGLRIVNGSSPYRCILAEFPEVTKPLTASTKTRHNVVHRIITNGNPVVAKARRLDPPKYAAAKKEFEYMLEQGVCRPSKSQYTNRLRMVPKNATCYWRRCGDYRQLNRTAKPD
ncbi:hypothetical protein M514_08683 [Trichuris suis]|uniref:Peptidase A2 domain-containing protein n=1 Tax=Trichuris suis TaxID=68888 RepID=A0A085MYP9_9BILA|nr:hypothetical protein M513_08683 [Trichuris suis]KFD62345.1 hypothetical protein M514_08683 [Trichuris suis]